MKIIELKMLDVLDMGTEEMMKQTGGIAPALMAAIPLIISVGAIITGPLSIIGVNYLFKPQETPI